MTRFGQTELQEALSDAGLTVKLSGDIGVSISNSTQHLSSRNEMKFDYNFPEESFRKLWSNGVPLVIMGVNSKLQSSWTPEYFIANYGRKPCRIEETSTGLGRKSTVAEFFSSFGKVTESRPVERLKVCKHSYLSSIEAVNLFYRTGPQLLISNQCFQTFTKILCVLCP